jgi:sec-independent protein translocase protein TatA
MGTPGPMELVVILLVALLIFGPGKLPQIGEGLGKGIRGFKKAISGKDEKDAEPSASEQSSAKEEQRKEIPGP